MKHHDLVLNPKITLINLFPILFKKKSPLNDLNYLTTSEFFAQKNHEKSSFDV